MHDLKCNYAIELIIKFIIFIYILSIYMLTYRIGYNKVSNIIGLLLIFFIFIKSFLFKKALIFNGFLALFFLFIIIAITTYFFSFDQSYTVIYIKTLLLLFLLVFAFANYIDDKFKIEYILNCFIYAGVIASLYLLINSNISAYSRIGKLLGDQNTLSFVFGISLLSSLYKYLHLKKTRYIFIVLLLITIILLTGSRSGLVFSIISFFILMVFYIRKNKGSGLNKLFLFLLLFVMVYAIYLLIYKIPLLYSIIGQRFDKMIYQLQYGGNVDRSFVTRAYMIEYGLELFKNRPLLGYGFGNYAQILGTSTGRFGYAHNNYIELLADVGLIGTTVYYSFYFYILYLLIKLKTNELLKYVFISFIIAILIVNISLITYLTKHFYIILTVMYSYTYIKRRENEH